MIWDFTATDFIGRQNTSLRQDFKIKTKNTKWARVWQKICQTKYLISFKAIIKKDKINTVVYINFFLSSSDIWCAPANFVSRRLVYCENDNFYLTDEIKSFCRLFHEMMLVLRCARDANFWQSHFLCGCLSALRENWLEFFSQDFFTFCNWFSQRCCCPNIEFRVSWKYL